jgi:hypothetical protein
MRAQSGPLTHPRNFRPGFEKTEKMKGRSNYNNSPSPLLKFGLLAGVAYFVCMATAHFFGLKYPLLFVYYDTPFYAYQDKIISFAVTAYVGLFYAASQNQEVVPIALFVMTLTVLGLISVNLSEALLIAMKEGQLLSTTPYWIQTILIAGYLGVLIFFYSNKM